MCIYLSVYLSVMLFLALDLIFFYFQLNFHQYFSVVIFMSVICVVGKWWCGSVVLLYCTVL